MRKFYFCSNQLFSQILEISKLLPAVTSSIFCIQRASRRENSRAFSKNPNVHILDAYQLPRFPSLEKDPQ